MSTTFEVYKITNLITNKMYIGQHCKHGDNYFASGLYINNSLKKHGIENFKREIIKICYSKEMVDYWEQYYIIKYNTVDPFGYNLTWGGEGNICSESTRKKLSENNGRWNKGIPCSEETKKKISNSLKGKIGTWKGKHLSETHKRKISEGRKRGTSWIKTKHHSKGAKKN